MEKWAQSIRNGSVDSTKAFCPATTNLLALSHIDSLNYYRVASCDQKKCD